ncbi:MAG TPA: hypothetical protein PKD70_05875 [Saprospiraceae bacterium]|nr:hypothetical protein [Saprospiraceae bacterium]HMP13388.1 hypothetical protein [Saprospiraceae bacterium]
MNGIKTIKEREIQFLETRLQGAVHAGALQTTDGTTLAATAFLY